MKPRSALQIAWRLLLSVSIAASPWSAAQSSVVSAAHDASEHEMPCHAPDADQISSPDTGGCEDDCCPVPDCAPAYCLSHVSGAVMSGLPSIATADVSDHGIVWHAPSPLHPPPGEALRPPIR